MRSLRACFALWVGAVGWAVLVPACSSGSSSSGPADSGPDVTTDAPSPGPDGSADAAEDSATESGGGGCPAYSGNVSFCQAAIQHCHTCNDQLTACAIQNFSSYCEASAAVFNPSIVPTLAQCEQSLGCTPPDGGDNPCLMQAVASATPSAAQQQVATDYCARCSIDAGSCTTDFFHVASDGGTGGPGALVLAFNDTIAQQIDTMCAQKAPNDAGAANCKFDFVFCAVAVASSAVPKNPCGDAAFADPPAPRGFDPVRDILAGGR